MAIMLQCLVDCVTQVPATSPKAGGLQAMAAGTSMVDVTASGTDTPAAADASMTHPTQPRCSRLLSHTAAGTTVFEGAPAATSGAADGAADGATGAVDEASDVCCHGKMPAASGGGVNIEACQTLTPLLLLPPPLEAADSAADCEIDAQPAASGQQRTLATAGMMALMQPCVQVEEMDKEGEGNQGWSTHDQQAFTGCGPELLWGWAARGLRKAWRAVRGLGKGSAVTPPPPQTPAAKERPGLAGRLQSAEHSSAGKAAGCTGCVLWAGSLGASAVSVVAASADCLMRAPDRPCDA
jgi:hypothetical protein